MKPLRIGEGKFVLSIWVTFQDRNPENVWFIFKIFFQISKSPMILEHGMKHWDLEPIIVCSNDESMLTMTHIKGQMCFFHAFIWERL